MAAPFIASSHPGLPTGGPASARRRHIIQSDLVTIAVDDGRSISVSVDEQVLSDAAGD